MSVVQNEILSVNNIGLRVANLDRSLAFYRDLLGLELRFASPWIDNDDMLAVGGVSGGSMRIAAMIVPGLVATLNLIEYDGVERTPVRARAEDPGTMHISLRVRGLDGWIEQCESAGFSAVAEPRLISGGPNPARIAFVADPDGFYVEFVEVESQ
jgi:lactoylglutathione lyase